MVIGETAPGGGSTATPGVLQEKIDNIMGGISNTGTVKMNNHRKKLRQRFDIIKKLGQGTYGKVQLGINKETGQEVAIKTIKKCKIEAESDLIRIRREVQIMSSVQHPNIIHIYEVFENREKMVLVMEFAAGGELYDYLSERKVLQEDEARRIFRQVATAVYYCHKHKICHRDLKLENILLDENGNAKIADFGLSNVFDEQRLLSTYCGSPLYASPEIVKGTPYQGPEVDCWSLGVLLYTLVYGAMPFDGSQFKRLVKQISQGDYYEPKKPSPASPLIREMLTVCPQRRANIEQICNHWWVNEGYSGSCLEIAEDLANQTPVRLDVLLSLSPPSVTADQLVVPSGEEVKSNVPRSHSVGSIRDIGNTEAERRILDMVAAGGEAALMPSPTRTITPNESPVQPKRKLESTVSTENAVGIVKKKERPTEQSVSPQEEEQANEMEVDEEEEDTSNLQAVPSKTIVEQDLESIENACEELLEEPPPAYTSDEQSVPRQQTVPKLGAVKEIDEAPVPTEEPLSPQKVIKKFVNKHKTADLVAAISKMSEDNNEELQRSRTSVERKSSLPDESLGRRRSRIMETAEKFQNLSNTTSDKPKKIVISGNSVSNYKKEFERKAADAGSKPTSPGGSPPELVAGKTKEESVSASGSAEAIEEASGKQSELSESESKTSVESFSLKEARRSMENSIALLNQAKEESKREVDQLCAKTESIAVTEPDRERDKKLKAREIIGNAIQPGGRICLGVRKPPVPFGMNGRSISGSVVPPMSSDKKTMRVQVGPETGDVRTATVSVSTPEQRIYENEPPLPKTTIKAKTAQLESSPPPSTMKTSRAEITLKSATLPRRKPAKTEIQLEIKPRPVEQTMRFSTEMQHQVPDLRSAPIREGPYSPISNTVHQRATSLEPAVREHVIPIQRPSAYVRTNSNSYRSGSLSRQSTNESDSDITTTGAQSQSTITTSSSQQPIKKSPREFIIPIAVEGGGYVTPRAGSLEPSDSGHTASSSAFGKANRQRRVGTLFAEDESGEDSHFHKIRSAISRDIDSEEPRFTMHRLRSTRPIKKLSQDTNDSQSSGEDDDEDGFEILTAENLFSTLLQRVRALTNRLNVNNDLTAGFPNSSRLLGNMRQAHTPFWQQEPFGRSQFTYSYKSETVEKKQMLNNNSGSGAAWRHNFSRDLGADIDSMFSRTGATLPRGSKKDKNQPKSTSSSKDKEKQIALDLADLDLSRLRLTKKDLETLSTITPNLPKCFQEQLLAKLPPTQARKLSRTLSMQNSCAEAGAIGPGRVYKRSLSGGRELSEKPGSGSSENRSFSDKDRSKESNERSEISNGSFERSSENACRRGSMGRDKYGYESAVTPKSRSSSTCRSGDDYSRSLCSSYTSDVSDRYKYYSPYLAKRSDSERPTSPLYEKESDIDRSVSPYKYYEGSSSPRNSCFSPVKEVYGRPPSGCLSPPPMIPEGSLRRRSSQRRISRFLRPDFFEPPVNEENAYVREKKLREREAQSVLREIREKSRERSRDRRNHSVERVLSYEDSLDNPERPMSMHHIRNKSVDRFMEVAPKESEETLQRRRRSVSRPREVLDENISNIVSQVKPTTKSLYVNLPNDEPTEQRSRRSVSRPRELTECIESDRFDAKDIANKILEELQNISLDTNVASIPRETKVSAEVQPAIIDNSVKEKVVKVKKVKTKDPGVKKEKKSSTSTKDSSSSEKQLEPKTFNEEKPKRESKLIRPKSYPVKEPEKITSVTSVKFEDSSPSPAEKEESPKDPKSSSEEKEKSRISRPKSYPNSKITPPKDFKKFSRSGMGISAVMEKLMEKAEKPAPAPVVKKVSSKSSSSEERQTKSSDSSTLAEAKPVKKVVKKKVVKSESKSSPDEKPAEVAFPEDLADVSKKAKSPEKKVGKGLLYAIGQKFKNLQENSKNKEKRSNNSTNLVCVAANSEDSSPKESDITVTVVLKKKKPKSSTTPKSLSPEKVVDKGITPNAEEKPLKPDKRSRIDAMIRSLRERSVPRAPVMTESGLIKRAVSVEDLTGAFNKSGVNKVLGLFKKYEKDGMERKVLNTRSTSNIERHITNVYVPKERPKSSGFMGKLKRSSGSTSTESPKDSAAKEIEKTKTSTQSSTQTAPPPPPPQTNSKAPCQDCVQELQVEARKRIQAKTEELEKSKEKRKGLLLDFSKIDNLNNSYKTNNNPSNNYSSLSYSTLNNNNCFAGNNCEINQNTLLTPSNENMTSYSSSSKSPHDDCPSSSTFLSPSEEPELCFDNWSVCSEDNYGISTPSPTVSRLSRTSQLSSPISLDANNPESVIDRIKRRSFYTRFNEKKPKRQSNIVGPAARDYYRESAAKLRSRPPDRIASPEIEPTSITAPEYLKPPKLNSNVSDLKPPLVQIRRRYDDDAINPTTSDYLKPRTYNDMLPSGVSSLGRRYGENDHIRRYEPSYASNLYNTYNPKRRSSFTSNGFVPASSTNATTASDRTNNIDGYATLGRMGKSIPNAVKATLAGGLRRDYQRTMSDFGNLPKSNLNLRNSSRSPTNI